MLVKIDVVNFAIIQKLSIELDEHLNIITGETGAGKSIIIDALGLVLGNRIDWGLFEGQSKKCVIEASFSLLKKKSLVGFLKTKGIELSEGMELILRKEINPLNKSSRNFINDNLVSVSELGDITSRLIDLHQQFDTLEIYNSAFQFNILDAVSGNLSLFEDYEHVYKKFLAEKEILTTIKNQSQQQVKDLEYWGYLYEELVATHLQEGELGLLEEEFNLLQNAEGVQASLSACVQLLYDNDNPIHSQIKQIIQQIKSLKIDNGRVQEFVNRLGSCQIELEDISKEMSSYLDEVVPNPKRMEVVEQRLNVIYKLFQKHHVKSIGELLIILNDLKTRLDDVENIEQKISKQEKLVLMLEKDCLEKGDILKTNRLSNIKHFEHKLHGLLFKIGMPNALFKVLLEDAPLNEFGVNKIDFLLDANKTNSFKPLKKVGSGGELNRLMLCIKSIVAESLDLPTLIFDEIDTGVSGEVAKQIGEILKGLGNNFIQIICITHQASIAAKGNKHFFVYKDAVNGVIQTNIKRLGEEERVVHLAEMLSGSPPTNNALAIAKEMLVN